MSLSNLEGSWVAVMARRTNERKVAERLYEYGYECFLPVQPKKKDPEATEALFPGYLFCRYQTQPIHRIIQIHNVLGIVCCGKIPVAVPEEVIDSVFVIVSSKLSHKPCKFLQKGQRVRVVSGPLTGLEGVFVKKKNYSVVVVNLDVLKRSVEVTVSISDIIAI